MHKALKKTLVAYPIQEQAIIHRSGDPVESWWSIYRQRVPINIE